MDNLVDQVEVEEVQQDLVEQLVVQEEQEIPLQ
jgi:hypothetical protein